MSLSLFLDNYTYPYINNIPVDPFKIAFNVGRLDTSTVPSIPSGLGPSIKKATAADTRKEMI